MLVWLPYGVPYLVVDNQLLLESLIGHEDVRGHACCSGKGHHKGPDYLVEALVDINAGSSDVSPSGVFELEVKLGKVPPFLGSCSRDACEHSRVSPSATLLLEVLDPQRCPETIQGRGDLEDAIGHGVAHVLGVFVQEHSSCSGNGCWPLVCGLDAMVASGEPLECTIREPAKISLRPSIHAWC